MKEGWQAELDAWQDRDLSTRRYVYFRIDGVYFNACLDQDRQCILVVIGVDEHGRNLALWLTPPLD